MLENAALLAAFMLLPAMRFFVLQAVTLAKERWWMGYYGLCKLAREHADAIRGQEAVQAIADPGDAAAAPLRHHPATPLDVARRYEAAVLTGWPLVRELSAAACGGAGAGGAAGPAKAKPEPPAAPTAKALSVKLPALIVMVGFPASGKSTFATALLAGQGDGRIARVNRDEMRGKGEVDAAAGAALRAGKCLLVDNCNLTLAHRKAWLDFAAGRSAWCIFFAADAGECRERIVRRVGHPTLPTAAAGLRALASLEGTLEPPSPAEGFERFEVVTSDDASNALIAELGGVPPPEPERTALDAGLLKFPRTPHIVNLGSATRDDKVLAPADVAALCGSGRAVVVQEKVDGANLGISLSPEGSIRVQNRSHFVSAAYHEQFRPLDRWVAKHSAELWTILSGPSGDAEPGRFILYGEWLHARHSIAYSRLPDLFLAFDLYDRARDEFVDHETLTARLEGTSIHIVPVIAHRPLRDLDELVAMARGPSQFTDGLREGVYVRLCEGGRVVLRGKIVRTDFICGNSHWTRGGVIPNVVAHEGAGAGGGEGAAAAAAPPAAGSRRR